MSRPQLGVEIEYPESDGEPMGETQVHIDWLIRLLQILQHRYRDQKVFVAGDLILYYVEGEPRHNVCPDIFVVKDLEPLPLRRVFKTWEEGRVPDVVFELTSLSTRRRDEAFKPRTYAEIGVGEYFLYDPTADYLDPPLQGHRLVGGRYQRIEPDQSGRLASEELDLLLQLSGTELEVFDRRGGERLLTEAEAANARWTQERTAREKKEAALAKELTAQMKQVQALQEEATAKEHERDQERAARKKEEAARKKEAAARKKEEAARRAAEAEVERLRKLLGEG